MAVINIKSKVQDHVWNILPIEFRQKLHDFLTDLYSENIVLAQYLEDIFGKGNITINRNPKTPPVIIPADVWTTAFKEAWTSYAKALATLDIDSPYASQCYTAAVRTLNAKFFKDEVPSLPKFDIGDKVLVDEQCTVDTIRSRWFDAIRYEFVYTLDNVIDENNIYTEYPESVITKYRNSKCDFDKLFKINDYVRCTSGEHKGQYGVVIDIEDDDMIGIDFTDLPDIQYVNKKDLVTVRQDLTKTSNAVETYNLNDRVTVIVGIHKGKCGTVSCVNSENDIEVIMDDFKSAGPQSYENTELQHIVDEPKPKTYDRDFEANMCNDSVNTNAKKPAEFQTGQKVCYNGYVYTVLGKTGKYYYALDNLAFDVIADDLAPYEPVMIPPKFQKDQKVIKRDDPSQDWYVITGIAHDEDGFPCYQLNGCEDTVYPEDLLASYMNFPDDIWKIIKPGKTYFSPVVGKFKFNCLIPGNHISGTYNDGQSELTISFTSDGRYTPNGKVMMYPSEELYNMYPNNPGTAWQEWFLKQTMSPTKIIVKICKEVNNRETLLSTVERSFETPATAREFTQACLNKLNTL